MLRSHLMSKKSKIVWRRARANALPPPPDCPSDQSEPQWASLIYTTDCTMCKNTRIQKVVWNLRLRGCEWCLKNNIVYAKRAPRRFPDVENLKETLELLPWTDTGGWAHGHASRSKFYHAPAIMPMSEALEAYQIRVDAGLPGAKQELEEFQASKRKQAEEIVAHGNTAAQWAYDASKMKNHLESILKEQRRDWIVTKLTELGHDPRDISRVFHDPVFDSTAEMTDSRWKAVHEPLETAVRDAADRRCLYERQSLLRGRIAIAQSVFYDYQDNCGTSTGALSPNFSEIEQWNLFRDIIERGNQQHVTAADFMEVLNQLSQLISDWTRTQKMELLQRTDVSLPNSNLDPHPESILNLARSCFACVNGRTEGRAVQFIDGSINYHPCLHLGPYPTKAALGCLKYQEKYSLAIQKAIVVAGRDPMTTTIEEMDQLDARFSCLVVGCGGQPGLALSWRTCAPHHDLHPVAEPNWQILSQADTQNAISIENNNKGDKAMRWICNEHPKVIFSRNGAISHAERTHNQVFDFADFRILRSTPPNPVSLTPSSGYRCGLCGANKTKGQLWSNLEAHFKMTHRRSIRERSDYLLPEEVRMNSIVVQPPAEGSNSTARYCCLLCDARRQNRRFKWEGLQQHAKDVHKIQAGSLLASHYLDVSAPPSAPPDLSLAV